MTKWIVLVVALIGLFGLTAAGCSVAVGTGPIIDKTYDLSGFKNIDISNAVRYHITAGDQYRVVISAQQSILNQMEVTVSSETLTVRLKPYMHTSADIYADITLPEISSLKISGASRGDVLGFESDKTLDIEVSGASQMDLDLAAGRTRFDISGASKVNGELVTRELTLDVSGASRCELLGSAENCDIAVSGASNLWGLEYKARECRINVSGASHGRIYCSEALDIVASGASTVTYSGNPQIKGLNISGASNVETK